MYRSYLSIYALSILLYSCSGGSGIKTDYPQASVFTETDFTQVEDLVPVESLELELDNPNFLFIKGDHLYTVNRNPSSQVIVYDIEEGAEAGRFLASGNGPGELIVAWRTRFSDDRNFVTMFSPMESKALVYRYDELHPDSPFRHHSEHTQVGPADEVTYMNNGDLVVMPKDMFSDRRVVVIHPDGTEKTISGYPLNDNDLTFDVLSMIYTSESVVNREGTKIALFYRLTDLIEIYDLHSGELQGRLHGPDNFMPVFQPKPTQEMLPRAGFIPDETRQAYFSPITVDDEIWVLYRNGSYLMDEDYRSSVLVFDWNGNPLYRYNLSGDGIVAIETDRQNRLIYALCSIPEHHIEVYQY